MAFWGRVWRIATMPETTAAACYNVTSADQLVSSSPSILTDTPISVASTQEAMGYWLDSLRRRTAANITATNQSEVSLAITIRRGTRTDTMVWRLANQNGKYPLYCSLVTPTNTESANFWNMGQAIDWMVQKLA